MQKHLQPQAENFFQGDIVFAVKSNKELWPAKIIKILPENILHIRFYMLRRHIKVNRDQIISFNSQTCQKFVNQNSTVFFLKVVQMAKKYVQRKSRQSQLIQQEQLNSSFILDDQDVKFQVESSRIQIPFSQKRGLFVIDEVLSNLQESQNENSCPQNSQKSSSNKKYINKGKQQVQLISLQQTQDQSTRKRYETRSQQRRKNRQAKKALLLAQKQKQMKQKLPKAHFQIEQSIQQVSNFINAEIQQALFQSNMNQFVQLQYSELQNLPAKKQEQLKFDVTQEQIQNYEENYHQLQNQPAQPKQQLQENGQNQVFYGPINITDLSTEASLNSIHTITFQYNNSTMASQNDIRSMSSQIIKERQSEDHFHFENIQSQTSTQEQSSDNEISVNISEGEIYIIIYQALVKLQNFLSGHSAMLLPQQQVKLSRSLDKMRQIQIKKELISKMIEFVNLFQTKKSKNKEKCYMEYIMIRLRLEILILQNKTQPKEKNQPQNIEILQNYQKRKQTIK